MDRLSGLVKTLSEYTESNPWSRTLREQYRLLTQNKQLPPTGNAEFFISTFVVGNNTTGRKLAAIGLVGFGISCNNVGTNILLQESSDESLRGHIVAIYTSIRFGAEAIGGLLAGGLAALFGAPWVMLGFCCLVQNNQP